MIISLLLILPFLSQSADEKKEWVNVKVLMRGDSQIITVPTQQEATFTDVRKHLEAIYHTDITLIFAGKNVTNDQTTLSSHPSRVTFNESYDQADMHAVTKTITELHKKLYAREITGKKIKF